MRRARRRNWSTEHNEEAEEGEKEEACVKDAAALCGRCRPAGQSASEAAADEWWLGSGE